MPLGNSLKKVKVLEYEKIFYLVIHKYFNQIQCVNSFYTVKLALNSVISGWKKYECIFLHFKLSKIFCWEIVKLMWKLWAGEYFQSVFKSANLNLSAEASTNFQNSFHASLTGTTFPRSHFWIMIVQTIVYGVLIFHN